VLRATASASHRFMRSNALTSPSRMTDHSSDTMPGTGVCRGGQRQLTALKDLCRPHQDRATFEVHRTPGPFTMGGEFNVFG
jgi:hypothetical protein